MAMDYYTAMSVIYTEAGIILLLGIWIFVLMANKWIRTIFTTMLSGSAYIAMIHNNDNSVDIVKAKRGKDGIMELINVPEKYGMKFAPDFNSVEKTNAFGTRIIHFYVDHNNVITPADMTVIDKVRKAFEKADVDFNIRNLVAFYHVMDKYESDEDVLAHMNLNYYKRTTPKEGEETDEDIRDRSRIFTIETLEDLRKVKEKLIVEPFVFQRSKRFLELVSETSSVRVQNVIQQHIEIERGLKGGIASKLNNNTIMWIILIGGGCLLLVMVWPYLQGMFGM